MAKFSAGLLVYRQLESLTIEVLLVHPGGPFWAKKDDGVWSIPKGEYEPGQADPRQVANVEFEEELGGLPPQGVDLDLGAIKQPSGKTIRIWAVEGDFDASDTTSNLFEMEWPPKSGKTQSFPEVDRAEWFTIDAARLKLAKGQVAFLDRLIEAVEGANGAE